MKITVKKEGEKLTIRINGKKTVWRNGNMKNVRLGKYFIVAFKRGEGFLIIVKKKNKVLKKVHLMEDGEVCAEL